jgi:hypothetical protein
VLSPGEVGKMRRTILVLAAAALVVVWPIAAAVPAAASSVPAPVTIHTVKAFTDTSVVETWSATGAIVDSGSFVDLRELYAGPSTYHTVRVFSGADGTFTVVANVRILPSADPDIAAYVVGRWTVTGGTGAYDDLHGGGTIYEEFFIASDSLVGTWTGAVLFG